MTSIKRIDDKGQGDENSDKRERDFWKWNKLIVVVILFDIWRLRAMNVKGREIEKEI